MGLHGFKTKNQEVFACHSLIGNFVSFSSNWKWRQVVFSFSRLPASSEILWFHISLLLLHLELQKKFALYDDPTFLH